MLRKKTLQTSTAGRETSSANTWAHGRFWSAALLSHVHALSDIEGNGATAFETSWHHNVFWADDMVDSDANADAVEDETDGAVQAMSSTTEYSGESMLSATLLVMPPRIPRISTSLCQLAILCSNLRDANSQTYFETKTSEESIHETCTWMQWWA